MTRYACSNPACPPRLPVTADAAPTCYTCAQPMAEAPSLTYNPNRAWFEFGGVRINGEHQGPFVEIPAPTPEQRASRTLPGLTISVTPPPITDPEVFARELQAEILRALTTESQPPYVGPGYRLLAKHGARPVCDCGAIIDEVLHADAATGRVMCQTCVDARLAATHPEAP